MKTVTPCPEWREQLSAYHDGELLFTECGLVEQHLSDCSACREALKQMDADRSSFTTAYAASTGGLELRTTVLEELRMQAPSPQKRKKFTWRLGFGIAGICVVLALAVVGIVQNDVVHQTFTRIPNKQAQIKVAMSASDNDQTLPTNGIIGYAQDNDEQQPLPSGWAKKTAAPQYSSYYSLNQTDGSTRHSIVSDAQQANNGINRPLGLDLRGGMHIAYQRQDTPSIAYDIAYKLQVKDALHSAQQAQAIIRKFGGVTVDFNYSGEDNEPPTATFHGKVRATSTDAALAEIEKLGRVRTLKIAGEDITAQLQQQQDLADNQRAHANALKEISRHGNAKTALTIEEKRSMALSDAADATRAKAVLAMRNRWVEFSAVFVEPEPRKPLHFTDVISGTRAVFDYAVLALIALLAVGACLALLIAPWLIWRYRRKQVAEPKKPVLE